MLATPSPVAYVQEHLSNDEKLQLAASTYAGTRALLDDCLAACVDAELRAACTPTGCCARAPSSTPCATRSPRDIMDRMFETVALVARILKASRDADRAISRRRACTSWRRSATPRAQLEGLVPAGFVSATGLERLRHLPRYLEAITAARAQAASRTPAATGSR